MFNVATGINPNTWSNLTFSELMKFDPKKAFEYRLQTLGEPIPEEYQDKVESVEAESVTDEPKRRGRKPN